MEQKYRKKPVEIIAIQWNGNTNLREIEQFVGKELQVELESETAYVAGQGAPIFSILIETKEGVMKAMKDDYIIKEPFPIGDRDFYPCKPDIFEQTYEPATPSPAKAEQEGPIWVNCSERMPNGFYVKFKFRMVEDKRPISTKDIRPKELHLYEWYDETPPVKEAAPHYKKTIEHLQPRERKFFDLLKYITNDEELALGYCGAFEEAAKEAGESAVWVKGNYERLYNQIKGGKRTVCYIDHPRFFQQRDICTIKPNSPDMEFSSRGHGYGGINDPGYCGSEIERFIQLCRGLNAEWLDESGLASSREREVAIAFAEWISQEPHLFGSANYGWYYDIPIDGAGVEHKLIGNTGDLYQYYLQSNNNT